MVIPAPLNKVYTVCEVVLFFYIIEQVYKLIYANTGHSAFGVNVKYAT